VAQIGCCRAETGANIARPERNSIWIVILPADGTALPNGGNGDFGTSPIYGQLSNKRLLAFLSYMGGPNVNHNSGSEIFLSSGIA
jgi:hypothetical protein